MPESRHARSALIMSTLAFTVCFACWVLNAVLVTFLVGIGELSFDETQVGWLLALPILTGAINQASQIRSSRTDSSPATSRTGRRASLLGRQIHSRSSSLRTGRRTKSLPENPS